MCCSAATLDWDWDGDTPSSICELLGSGQPKESTHTFSAEQGLTAPLVGLPQLQVDVADWPLTDRI